MFHSSQLLSRRGTIASLTALFAGLATAGVAWGASAATSQATATHAAQAASALRTCSTTDLYLSMGRKEGAAGSLYWPVTFTNTSTTSCALRGYPGVSVLDTAHKQIGPAATRTGRAYSTVTLTPGHSASAVVRTANGPVGGSCLRTGAYLRVYPPASYKAVLVPAPWKICSGLFQVGPVNTQGAI
ncbi:DUF4232 domain-containing protein [Streptomyces brasiliensis]|uniref:DUF4232 domain-containing protein n=1 Tax=Streptomyces brasiliensis TaxID=1954 RepID=A0A917NPH9_9ACTN|nr:DUF4232 domain-containing protein [Streptomyces brasiliensis]GGJ13070.1 hypothetical protein GCM10010121_024300 [Streptomyces brasiliensis]